MTDLDELFERSIENLLFIEEPFASKVKQTIRETPGVITVISCLKSL